MFVQAGDLTVYCAIDDGPAEPRGAPAVLLHALGASHVLWDEQARVLGGSRRVVRPDMRGHGLTETTPGPYALDQLAEDVLRLLDVLAIDRVHLAGISLGGMIAQALASRAPERVRSLTLVATALALPPPSLWHERAAAIRRDGVEGLVDGIVGRWVSPAYAASPAGRGIRTMLLRTPREGYAAACEALAAADLHDAPRPAGLPVLVIVGSEDRGTPVPMADELCRVFAGATRLVVPGAAHIPLGEHAETVTSAIEQFLQPLD
jgi:3-oxoadipate enol-lactonase